MDFDGSVYDDQWFEYLSQFDENLRRAMFGVWALLGKPGSVLDVGCGTGATIVEAEKCEIMPAVGVELMFPPPLNQYPKYFVDIVEHDLRQPLDLDYRFDHVYCWEVAEHLPEENADILCDTLEAHTGKFLIFTAAHEDQGGQYHLNEQPKEYWIEKLQSRGLFFHADYTVQLQQVWTWTTGPCHWLPENVMVFERSKRLSQEYYEQEAKHLSSYEFKRLYQNSWKGTLEPLPITQA